MKRKLRISVEGKTYGVEVEEIGVEDTGTALVSPTPTIRTVEIQQEEQAKIKKQKPLPEMTEGAKAHVDGRKTIVAPIPGKVISIKTKQGKTIRIGETVLTLEAMKMENEISTTVDGVVKEIFVKEGQLVNLGDPLAVIG